MVDGRWSGWCVVIRDGLGSYLQGGEDGVGLADDSNDD